jgi:hypothetical protein
MIPRFSRSRRTRLAVARVAAVIIASSSWLMRIQPSHTELEEAERDEAKERTAASRAKRDGKKRGGRGGLGALG